MGSYKFITINQYLKTLSLWVSYNFLYYNLTGQDYDAYYEVLCNTQLMKNRQK